MSKTQITDLTNDFPAERQWTPTPFSLPHWQKVSPEDPFAPNKTNFITANTIGAKERFGIENLPTNFGPVKKWEYQFAYNGTVADFTPGVTLEFVVGGTIKASIGILNLDSVGLDAVGQVTFKFSPPLSRADFDNGSVRHISEIAAGGSFPPDPPNFSD